MTPQDTRLLQDFLDQLAQAQVATKDPEAQVLINRTFARQPDAAYSLVQRSVLLEQALKQAHAQIAQLQQQSAPVPATAPAPGYAPLQATSPAPQPASPWGSFLGNAATTAAGVAGGALLFQGLGHLFGHDGQSLGAGMPGGSNGGDRDSSNQAEDDDASDTADSVDDDDSSDFDA